MDRRTFFRRGIVGGVAAAAAVRRWPFRVFSFPPEIKPVLRAQQIRFIKAFDPIQSRMMTRFDVLYGFGKLENPPYAERSGLEDFELNAFAHRMLSEVHEPTESYPLPYFAAECSKQFGEKTVILSLDPKTGDFAEYRG